MVLSKNGTAKWYCPEAFRNCTVRGNILVVHGTTKDLTVGEPVEEQRGLSEIDSSGFSDGSIARSYHGLLGC
jgi:hypothetical protein